MTSLILSWNCDSKQPRSTSEPYSLSNQFGSCALLWSFPQSASSTYGQTHQALNPELQALQDHVRTLQDNGDLGGMVLLDCDGSHWVSYVYDGSSVIYYGDSLGPNRAGANRLVIQALNWFLEDAGLQCVEEVARLDVSTQSFGSQSCALAAFNAVEVMIGIPGVRKWEPGNSDQHRLRWIEDILTIHLLASQFMVSTCENLAIIVLIPSLGWNASMVREKSGPRTCWGQCAKGMVQLLQLG